MTEDLDAAAIAREILQGEVVEVEDPKIAASLMPAERAFELDAKIKAGISQIRRNWIDLAEHFYAFYTEKAWKSLGYENLRQWAAEPDIDLNHRQVYRLVEVWQTYVIESGISREELLQLNVSNAHAAIRALKRGAPIEEVVADVRELTIKDLNVKYNDGPKFEDFATCMSCGSRYRVKS